MLRAIFMLAAMAISLAPQTSFSQTRTAYSRAIFVESPVAGGMRAITPARQLRRGDRVVLVIEWPTGDSRRGVTLQSAIPADLQFQRSSLAAMEVSVDGGRNWGALGTLRVNDDGRTRIASPEQVTNIRWNTADADNGRLTYSAIVR